ncbi:MAG: 50S ribosomal protein L25 [Bacteroidota bacterium]
MKTIALQATVRNHTGKRDTKAIRNSGRVPGVVYDDSKATHIHLDYKETQKVLYTKDTYVVTLNMDAGDPVEAIVREAQFHPVKEQILHIDFLRVTGEKPVVVELPVKLVGTPKGVAQGGKLTIKLRKIKVKGIVSELPEELEVDVTNLDLGGTVKVGQADFGEIEVVTPASSAVASVEIPRALRSAEAEDGEGEGEGEAAVASEE